MAAEQLSVLTRDGVRLAGEQSGAGPPIVLLHGLTATRRYVVMGSRLLERSGHRVIAYDARGHGRSAPARDPRDYGYEQLAEDLLSVLDALGIERALLAGASMGAHTILRFALAHPERVTALGVITPAYDPQSGELAAPGSAAESPGRDPQARDVPAHLAAPADFSGRDVPAPPAAPAESPARDVPAERDPLARGLREGGVEGFLRAYDFANVPEAWRGTVETVIRQRLSAHEYPAAVADALEVVPCSRPFAELGDLGKIAAPTLVVASRDEVDPGHPLALAERYAAAIPGAQLSVEEGGPPVRSPIAWQGGQLSKALLDLARRAG